VLGSASARRPSVVRHSVELRCPSAGPRDERDPVGVEICRTGWVADL
jgi:hypothetical protein